MERKYYFSIGTMFKNESHIMKEWIEHYLFHGVEHIYIINDGSTDNFLEILEPYINSEKVTLFDSIGHPYYLGRQRNIYNEKFNPILKYTFWFGIFDMDEFLFSVRDIDLKNVLKHLENLGEVQIRHTLFGSNGLETQPKYVVPSFTKREKHDMISEGIKKYIINTNFEFESLIVHYAKFKNPDEEKKLFLRLDFQSDLNNPWFTLNHYMIQSKEFWKNIKCTRGDSDGYLQRDMELFNHLDKNDVEDMTLYEQNKELYDEYQH